MTAGVRAGNTKHKTQTSHLSFKIPVVDITPAYLVKDGDFLLINGDLKLIFCILTAWFEHVVQEARPVTCQIAPQREPKPDINEPKSERRWAQTWRNWAKKWRKWLDWVENGSKSGSKTARDWVENGLGIAPRSTNRLVPSSGLTTLPPRITVSPWWKKRQRDEMRKCEATTLRRNTL